MKFGKLKLKINGMQNNWSTLQPINLEKIQVVPFSDNCYFKEIFKKTQICLHHTISGDGVNGDISTWENDDAVVGTAFIIDRAGTPWQLFSSKYWAWHLGVGKKQLDSQSIGIELDNWGWLIPGDGTVKKFGDKQKEVLTQSGKYYTYYGNAVAVPLQYYANGFRGYNYYEKYSESQLRTAGELILYWKMKYGIPMTYHEDMWDVSERALGGEPGIWGHISYRSFKEKQDVHPQPELIDMLKTISKL